MHLLHTPGERTTARRINHCLLLPGKIYFFRGKPWTFHKFSFLER